VLAACPALRVFEFELGAVNDVEGPLALLREPATHITRVRMRQTPPLALLGLPVAFVRLALAMRENHLRHVEAHAGGAAAAAAAAAGMTEALVVTASAVEAAQEAEDEPAQDAGGAPDAPEGAQAAAGEGEGAAPQ
jgi:hypothetical protein